MEPSATEVDSSSEETPDFTSNPGRHPVTCCETWAYEDERRELFQPSREQVRDARRWLVRVIARRAVEILKAQETGP